MTTCLCVCVCSYALEDRERERERKKTSTHKSHETVCVSNKKKRYGGKKESDFACVRVRVRVSEEEKVARVLCAPLLAAGSLARTTREVSTTDSCVVRISLVGERVDHRAHMECEIQRGPDGENFRDCSLSCDR